ADQGEEDEEGDGPSEGLGGHEGDHGGSHPPRAALEDVPDQEDSDQGDAGEVEADCAEGFEESREDSGGADGFGGGSVGAAEVEGGADLVGDDEWQEEDEDVEGGLGDQRVGERALEAVGGAVSAARVA